MCDHCGAVICAIFDRMIMREVAFLAVAARFSEGYRPKYYSLNVAGITSGEDADRLSELVARAEDIGMDVVSLEAEICARTKMPEPVKMWIRDEQVPNGLVRKIILTNVEEILKERGAQPQRSTTELVPV
ncbi:hypothetical protein KC887_06895 [Candidatus Kaiserbacteria bacterium]|nr:hypothetical protein [Candidatus Kaiserbacteria bacterium]